jgi:hypothetical protein
VPTRTEPRSPRAPGSDEEPARHGLDGGSSPKVGVHGGAATAASVVTFLTALRAPVEGGGGDWLLQLGEKEGVRFA